MSGTTKDYLKFNYDDLPQAAEFKQPVGTSSTTVVKAPEKSQEAARDWEGNEIPLLVKTNGESTGINSGEWTEELQKQYYTREETAKKKPVSTSASSKRVATASKNESAISPNAPLVGSIVAGTQTLKDEFNQSVANWTSLLKNLGNVASNPRATYFLATQLLRAKAVTAPPHVNDSTLGEGEKFIRGIMGKLGVNKLLKDLGIGGLGKGVPYVNSGSYLSTVSDTKDTFKIKEKDQGSTAKSSETIEGSSRDNATKKSVYSQQNNTFFKLLAKTPQGISFETAKPYNEERFKSQEKMQSEGLTLDEDILPDIAKEFIYKGFNDPYEDITKTTFLSSEEKIKEVMTTLHALRGYETWSNFTPRNDLLWNVRLYPYAPGKEYKFFTPQDRLDETEARDYYGATLTPPLPIRIIPGWEKGITGDLECVAKVFDFELWTPVISYQLDFGNTQTDSLEFGPEGYYQMEWAENFQYGAMRLSLSMIDDEDATLNKYFALYFNTIYDKDKRARAPLELSSFVADICVFKAAHNLNYRFKLIVTPTQYTPSLEGSADSADTNSGVRVEFSVLGVLPFKDKDSANYTETSLEIGKEKWNDINFFPTHVDNQTRDD